MCKIENKIIKKYKKNTKTLLSANVENNTSITVGIQQWVNSILNTCFENETAKKMSQKIGQLFWL